MYLKMISRIDVKTIKNQFIFYKYTKDFLISISSKINFWYTNHKTAQQSETATGNGRNNTVSGAERRYNKF